MKRKEKLFLTVFAVFMWLFCIYQPGLFGQLDPRGKLPASQDALKDSIAAVQARLDSLLTLKADTSATNALSAKLDSLAAASYSADSLLQLNADVDSLAEASAVADTALENKAVADSSFLDSLARAAGGGGDTYLNGLTLADSTGEGIIDTLIIGETVAVGNALYSKSDGELWLADCDTSITLPARYLALEAGSANDTIAVLKNGNFKASGWSFATGSKMVVSATAGQIKVMNTASGEWLNRVGEMIRTDVIAWDPDGLSILKN